MKRMISKISWLIMCIFANSVLFAGNPPVTVSGKVTDANTQEAIPYASIHLVEKNDGTLTDEQGLFSFTTENNGKIRIKVSYLGYQSVDTLITARQDLQLRFRLQLSDYSLKEVVVSSKESVGRNATSVIEKKALEHIQPSSFTDILQLLPGHSTQDPKLSNPNFITMRQAGYDDNTSLGTAFVIDGATMTNDANLQDTYGMSSSTQTASRLTVNKGIDMRTISTDRIESVEVVRGIPSVKYGDLTAGLVKIDLKGGKTPWEARVKTDLSNKLLSLGKGFSLPHKQGLLNIDADYLDFSPDPRTEISSYKRATFSGRYQNLFRISENTRFFFKTNLSYTGSFDNEKKDPDYLQAEDDYYKNSYNNFLFSSNGKFQFKEHFLKSLDYNFSLNYTREKTDISRWISPGVMPMPTAMTEGPHDAEYLPPQYRAQLTVDGQPVDLNAKIEARKDFKITGLTQEVLAGAEFRYDKNTGDGEIYDLTRPLYPGTKTSRPRAFKDIPALQKFSIYAEDDIHYRIQDWMINASLGVRGTTLPGLSGKYTMNGKIYWEPRINMKATFPVFSLFNTHSSFALTGGFGRMYKFPTQAQLFPSNLYMDHIQLNYYSQQENLRALNVYTYVEDPTNYHLVPALNTKYEAGFVFIAGNIKLDMTFFKENMDNGFSAENRFVSHTFRDYDESSVPPGSISGKPSVNDFSYINDTLSMIYGGAGNAAGVYKKGIEYQLTLGEIPYIQTRVWLNGAWFETHYTHNSLRYYKPSVTINNDYYPYVGIYNYWENGNYTKSQVNTNLYLDTHLPSLKMIFTTSIQTMWFEKRQDDWDSGMPLVYLDNAGRLYPFDPKTYASAGYLEYLVDEHDPYDFLQETTPMACNVNLKLTKEIGKNIRLAFYVNRILSYNPSYESARGMTITRTSTPSFGAELNIKL